MEMATVMRSVIKTKTPARTILTCDAAGFAGCPPGIYQHGSGRFEVLADGRIVIAGQDQLLAGSTLATETCVANAMSLGGVSLRDAVDMAGRYPARLFGLEEIRLARGSRADFFIFSMTPKGEKLQVLATVAAGMLRFGNLPVC